MSYTDYPHYWLITIKNPIFFFLIYEKDREPRWSCVASGRVRSGCIYEGGKGERGKGGKEERRKGGKEEKEHRPSLNKVHVCVHYIRYNT